ncbi:MAG: thermonuclease family protein [Kangiellaceae bacterium]|nr:thermonuclease family protein [Kangiellaceae bacterium]
MQKVVIIFFLALAINGCERANGEYQAEFVQDGDSVVICCEQGETFIVRLRDIDAPEKQQPYAEQSRDFLRQLLQDQTFKLKGLETDRYGRRLVDIILVDKQSLEQYSVNKLMIESGSAWVWRYSNDYKLRYIQKQARDEKKGLWALPESQRLEPWLWREQYRRNKKSQK